MFFGGSSDDQVIVADRVRSRVRKPSMYRVILLNDDYTPMEFVVVLVQEIFNKSAQEAVMLTLEVHQRGSAVCGVYTREVAETKVNQVVSIARRAEHPLACRMEQE